MWGNGFLVVKKKEINIYEIKAPVSGHRSDFFANHVYAVIGTRPKFQYTKYGG